MTSKELLVQMWRDPWYGLAVIVMAIVVIIPASFYAMKEKPQTFKEWFIRHKPTCKECNDPSGAICVEAFERLQAALKRGEEI